MRVKAGGSLRKLSFKAPCSWAALFVGVGAKTGVRTNSRAHALCPVPAFSLWHVSPWRLASLAQVLRESGMGMG